MISITLVNITVFFIVLFILREVAAWKGNLRLKYFFTPLVTMTVISIPVLSIAQNGITMYNALILTALLLALAADTMLMIEEVSLLKSGMIFFLAGHIFYAAAFFDGTVFKPWNAGLIILLAVLNFFLFKKLMTNAGNMLIHLFIYLVAINIMLYLAVTGLNGGVTASAVSAASGAVLFAISDFIHSINSFVRPVRHSTVYTWIFYAPAQFLIALSTLNVH